MPQCNFAIALHQAKPMTVVRLLNAQPDIYASERILLGEIAFCAALSEKLPILPRY